jgi:hypothetical protein
LELVTIAEYDILGKAEEIQDKLSIAGIKSQLSKDAQYELQVLEKDVVVATELIEYFCSQN